jgi:hypothetical protein
VGDLVDADTERSLTRMTSSVASINRARRSSAEVGADVSIDSFMAVDPLPGT